MDFPHIDEATRIQRLAPPEGRVDMVLDTDTFNEIDDQFAVAYSILSPEHMNVEAIYAAPFSHHRTPDPADGMQQSYEEILRLLERLDRPHEGFALKGSPSYLPGADQPVDSPAARDLVEKALADREGDLYVLAIGAITNVASAILLEPGIIERIVVVWLGGQPHYWPTAVEYNLHQDVHAARVILDCGVPFMQIPCKNVSEHLTTTVPELEVNLKGRNPIADYLFEIFCAHHEDHFAWAKVIWDISAVAWLINSNWVPSVLAHSPILTDQVTWSLDWSRHFIRVATHCDRNAIFADLFRKLQAQ
ncbi:MAG: nucleoside hydrolase [Armatimonadetes bacterium]|nr:nucleoside hydrolase [Armatimonadota bacterium]